MKLLTGQVFKLDFDPNFHFPVPRARWPIWMHWLVHLLVVHLTIYTLKKQRDNSSAGIILKPTQSILESLIYTVKWSPGVIMSALRCFQYLTCLWKKYLVNSKKLHYKDITLLHFQSWVIGYSNRTIFVYMHEIDRFWALLSTARPYREYKASFTPYSRPPILAYLLFLLIG